MGKEITEHIDDADAAKTDATHSNIEAIARLEKLETEFQSSQRRMQLVKKDLADFTGRGEVADEKLKKSRRKRRKRKRLLHHHLQRQHQHRNQNLKRRRNRRKKILKRRSLTKNRCETIDNQELISRTASEL